MKNKAIRNEIKSSLTAIKSAKKKGAVSQAPEKQALLKTLTSVLGTTISLQKEVQKLKNDLKKRKKDLAAAVKKLVKNRKEVKKAQKKDKRATTSAKDIKSAKVFIAAEKSVSPVRPKARKTAKPVVKTRKAARRPRRKNIVAPPPAENVQ